jgi:hypothetical protein
MKFRFGGSAGQKGEGWQRSSKGICIFTVERGIRIMRIIRG